MEAISEVEKSMSMSERGFASFTLKRRQVIISGNSPLFSAISL